jgi:6-phosphofructokinase 1
MMSTKIKRIGVLTGGGDCPRLNDVIRAAVKTAITEYQWEVWGIENGFEGLIQLPLEDAIIAQRFVPLDSDLLLTA